MYGLKTSTAAIALLALTATASWSDDAKAFDIDIKPQALTEALREFSNKTQMQLIYSQEQLEGLKTTGVEGHLDATAALNKLLEKTNLTVHKVDDTTIAIRQKTSKLDKTSLAIMQDSPKSTDKATTNPSSDGTASLSGHVSEMNTGSNLAGALVRIIETGQTTKTDDLGNFRFPTIVPGNYTLSISYLGFASRITEITLGRGEEFEEEYSLGKALGELDEIVVFGSRSARARALNLQRTAENSSDVVSADDLGNFTGTTISEALRRVAGVSFLRDRATGDGTNIIIRGLEPDMNAVKLNGLNLAVGNGTDRSADLSTMLIDSIDKITIHKTLLPSHDSSGTGGLVEIETKSPLNRPHRYVNLSVEGGKKGGDFGNDLNVSGTVAGTFGSDDNFGLSASVQYRKRKDKSLSYGTGLAFGQYLPLSDDGTLNITAPDEVDPRLNFPFEAGNENVYSDGSSAGSSESTTENFGLTLSAEWQVADHTNLKVDVVHAKNTSSRFNANVNASLSSPYVQRTVAELGGEVRYALTYSDLEAEGDRLAFAGYNAFVRHAYSFSDGDERVSDNYSFRGNTSFGKWDINYTLGYAHGTSQSGNNGSFAPLFDDELGGTLSENFFLPEATDPVEGIIITPYGKRTGKQFVSPLFSDLAWDFFNDADSYFFIGASTGESRGKNDRYTAEFSAKYDFDQEHLKYLEVGVTYETSEFSSDRRIFNVSSGGQFSPIPLELDFANLTFEETDLTRIGTSSRGFNFLTEDSVQGFFNNLDQFTTGDDPLLTNTEQLRHPAADDAFTNEQSLAAYIQGRIDIGKLEIIGGVRFNRVKTHAVYLNSPEVSLSFFDFVNDPAEAAQIAVDFATVLDETAVQTDILPRVAFNYRENDNLIFRGGYFMTTARPSITDLSKAQSITLDFFPFYGGSNNQPLLLIKKGNPNLKPAITHNFDLSVEYYHDQIGVMRLSAYYKTITNSLQNNDTADFTDLSGVEFPDHRFFTDILQTLLDENAAGEPGVEGPNPFGGFGIYVQSSQPENSTRAAKLWGFEAHIERQFTFLPGIWNGFGMYANFNYSDSKAQQFYIWRASPILEDGETQPIPFPVGAIERGFETLDVPDQSFNTSPQTSGTVALTYNKYSLDATLAYGFQARHQSGFSANNLNRYSEGVGTLDFRASYYFEMGAGQFRAFVEGTDLLKGKNGLDLGGSIGGTDGSTKYYTGGSYLGGRKIRVGLSATF